MFRMETPRPRYSREELNAIWQVQKAREAERREQIRLAVASTTAPLPAALVDALISLHDGYMREIMRVHAGFELSEKRDSYRASLATMELSLGDLIAAIDGFAAQALAENTALFTRPQEQNLLTIKNRIQKELFATANAAVSLVEHSRRIQKVIDLPEHADQLKKCFGDDGLHDFVIALRVLLHHLHIVGAGWQLRRSATEKRATFTLSKATLVRIVEQRKKSLTRPESVLRYLTVQVDSIDLKPVFEEYRRRVAAFHAWFSDQLAAESLVELRDYARIMRDKTNYDQRLFWKAMLGNWLKNWKVPPDPHHHLHRYLTEDQMRDAYALPRNSKAQVDFIIGIVDEYNAIDEELRAMAYELFERSTSASPTEHGRPEHPV